MTPCNMLDRYQSFGGTSCILSPLLEQVNFSRHILKSVVRALITKKKEKKITKDTVFGHVSSCLQISYCELRNPWL